MTETPPPIQESDTTAISIREVMASLIYGANSVAEVTIWRDLPLEERNLFRDMAKKVTQGMLDAGLKISVTKGGKEMAQYLDELLTVPARRAFEPGN